MAALFNNPTTVTNPYLRSPVNAALPDKVLASAGPCGQEKGIGW